MIYCVTFDPCISWMPCGVLFPLDHQNYFIDGAGDYADPLTLPLRVMDYMCVEL